MAKPRIAQKSPFVEDLKPGKYAWCSCGESSKEPYFDGSHKDTEFVPIVEKIDEPKRVAWCGCKHTGNKPYCDGSHAKLGFIGLKWTTPDGKRQGSLFASL